MLENEKDVEVASNDTQKLIDEAVAQALAKAKEEAESKFNNAMAKARVEKEKEIAKIREDATLTAEEKAKKEKEEELALTKEENARLKSEIKNKTINEKLVENKLPAFFKNDVRLINATDDELDATIKIITKEFEETKVVNQHGTTPPKGTSGKNTLESELERLKNL